MNETTNDQNPAELSPLDGLPGVGDLLRSDPARVARYAEALWSLAVAGLYEPVSTPAEWDKEARAVMAVADEERAALVAEVERLKRGGKTLGEIIDKQCQMVLDATGLHDWVDEDGDGDWGAIWDHLFALRSRAESAEAALAVARAQVEAVRALADELEANRSASWPYAFKRLRAALSSAAADTPEPEDEDAEHPAIAKERTAHKRTVHAEGGA